MPIESIGDLRSAYRALRQAVDDLPDSEPAKQVIKDNLEKLYAENRQARLRARTRRVVNVDFSVHG